MDTFKNPLETVQLIPIFNYLNILSDFLFIERYLEDNDQNKQIPIVNALYKYLEYYEYNQAKKVELIRTLLKGSDLYGENDDEHFNIIFVNAMFDYIITSLVFDKYGNIYGFLATIFCKAENLQIDQVLNLIMTHLEDASFENEYGDNSILSTLARNRIYNDIILPLFPRPNVKLSLFSVDYIYAQAGSMFLRSGRINTIYYRGIENSVSNLTKYNLFDEYLATGHVIEKLILTEEKNVEMLKAFALPALTYHIFNSKYLFLYENMENVIYDSDFWQTAYKQLFQYTSEIFNDMEVELTNDYTFKMNVALSSFQSSTAIAKSFLEHHCTNLNENQRTLALPFYLQHPKTFQCKVDEYLPSVEEYFQTQISNVTKIYEMYDLQLVQEAFPKSLVEKLETTNVIIKLLIPENLLERGAYSESQHLPFDVLEFYYPNDLTFDHYLLRRRDYHVTLIYQAYNPELFEKENRMYFEKLIHAATSKILKRTEDSISVFFQNLVKYKTSRLRSYLEIFDNREGEKFLKTDWWKEFGFSLVPYYPCLSDTSGINYGNSCKLDEVKFSCKYQNEPSRLISRNTQSFLSSVGTSIRSLFLKNASWETVDEIVTKEQENRLSILNALNRSELFEDIGQHLEDPAFSLTFTTNNKISVLKQIMNSLKEKTNLNFSSVMNSLSKILILKSNLNQSVGVTGKNRSRLLFANTLYNETDSYYGYKIIFISVDGTTAQLRTGYEFKDKRLVLPILNSTKSEKKYIVLNNETFEPEPDQIMYEINNQLRRRPIKVLFSGIPIQADDSDENCSDDKYFEKWKHLNICRRRRRSIEKNKYEEDAVRIIKNNKNLSEQQVRNTLEKFTFPDNATLMQFVNHWLSNKSLTEPFWSRSYIIVNPDLLSDLRYNFRFENHNVCEPDGIFRINSLYSKKKRRKIEEVTSLETIIKDFNEQNATYSVSFHDYYAIQNFATTGYRRITRDTREAKLMKSALYKLAIRQSDDPIDEFDLKLFRVEYKPISVLGIKSYNDNIHLQKFTPAFPSIESAIRLAGYPAPGFMNIVYEMIFYGPYMRAKIEQFYKKKEESVILLPGSKFLITESSRVDIGGLGKVLKLKLEFKHVDYDKYLWYRNIMNEIGRITV